MGCCATNPKVKICRTKTEVHKMGISIRFRKVSKGLYSAYIDCYHKGKRTYEHTAMVLTQDYSKPILDRNGKPKLNEKGQPIYPRIKQEDRDKLEILERLKLEREVSILQNTYSFVKREKKTPLVEFIAKIGSTKKSAKCYTDLIPSLNEFVGAEFSIQDFDEEKLRGYFFFLRKKGYGENTIQKMYFGINATLNQAVREKIIVTNPKAFLARHEIPSGCESKREFLSSEELKRLWDTPFPNKNKQIADAFIVGCMTGLRVSDLCKIKHSDVVDGFLQYRQKKSSKQFHYLPLNPQAQSLINEQDRNPLTDIIFWKLPNNVSDTAKILRKWATDAGVTKHITWHVSRHTHATILLNEGVDLFTVSKLLGHYSVNTTQRYAKVVNKSKVEAIAKFPALY